MLTYLPMYLKHTIDYLFTYNLSILSFIIYLNTTYLVRIYIKKPIYYCELFQLIIKHDDYIVTP